MSEGRNRLKESIGEGFSNRVTFEQRPGWRGVASSKDIQGTAGSRPQTQACTQHVPGGRCGQNKVMEWGGTREETEARVKEGHTVGTSQATLSDSQPWESPLPVLGQPSHGELLCSPCTLPPPILMDIYRVVPISRMDCKQRSG